MFQNLAPFQHMTVFENIALGLRAKKNSAVQVRERITRTVETLQIAHLLAKKPAQ
jgi:ABC-type sugar transport system ATPase subunit